MKEETFRQRCPDLIILDPVAFLQAIAGQEQPEPTTRQEPEQLPEATPRQKPGTGVEQPEASS
jgi:hypothetical protein